MSEAGILYVVATPIGNLGDITDRARQVLAQVHGVAAEDTRRTLQLLTHFGIKAKLWSYQDHNEDRMAERLLTSLSRGEDIALVSDAGTPLINDPGFTLVRAARLRGFRVVPVPGANAAICALSVAGLPCDRFLFLGFPPRSMLKRREWLTDLGTEPGTLVVYEAGNRARTTIEDMADVLGSTRHAVIARELTKQFETFLDGTLGSLAERLRDDPKQQLGELVLLVEGLKKGDETTAQEVEEERVMAILSETLPLKQAATLAARITGGKRNRLYQLGLRRQASCDREE